MSRTSILGLLVACLAAPVASAQTVAQATTPAADAPASPAAPAATAPTPVPSAAAARKRSGFGAAMASLTQALQQQARQQAATTDASPAKPDRVANDAVATPVGDAALAGGSSP